jgi:C-terminal processing protease CtpA/Prc
VNYRFFFLIFLSFFILKASSASDFSLSASHSSLAYKPSDVGVVGIRYLHKPGTYSQVEEVYPNTPAANSGILYGDRILEIDGISVKPYDANGVFGLMAGKPGEKVRLKLLRCNPNCYEFSVDLIRLDMNSLTSDTVFRIYKYGF